MLTHPVTAARRLWEVIHGDPVFMRRINGWLTLFWVAMIPVSYELVEAAEGFTSQ